MPKKVQVPVAALRDPELKGTALRVLAALCSFDKGRGLVSPHRQAITDMTGIPEARVSRITTELCHIGWIRKVVTGGKGRACSYFINWDKTVSDSDTVGNPQTVPKSDTVSGRETVSESGTVTQPNGVNNEHRLGAQTVSDGDEKRPNGVRNEHRLEPQTVSKNDTPYLDSSNNYTHIRSGSDARGLNFNDVVEFLHVHHGMPMSFVSKPQDASIVRGWVERGLTEQQLQAACDRARHVKNDGRPFGPRYIDKVINTLENEANGRGKANRRAGGFSAGDAVGENWLEQERAKSGA
ncbi:MAG TPA: hypothetical protein VKA50_00045 [Gammaproteobacteria bacterium]|nr:hypothetical protein [Gammaproteobacteria bacterium]